MRAFRLSLLVVFVATSLWYHRDPPLSVGQQAGALSLLHQEAASAAGAGVSLFYESPVLAQNFPDPAVIEVA